MDNVKHIIAEPVSTKENKVKDTIISIIVITIGSIFIAIVNGSILNPAHLYAGGVTGLAQIFLQLLGIIFKGGESMAFNKYLSIVNFLFLLPFNILAFFKLSRKYAYYTFYSSVIQTIVMSFSDFWESFMIFGNPDNFTEGNRLTCVLMAAVINGISNGYMMKRGATSGGVITLCQYLNLKKGKSVGSINIAISTMIVSLGALITFLTSTFESRAAVGAAIATALYTLLFFILDNIVLDHVHTAYNKIKMDVVTEKGEYITEELLKEFHHGLTIYKAVGGYTKNEKEVLAIVLQSFEAQKYVTRIKELDPESFITMEPIIRFDGYYRPTVIDK